MSIPVILRGDATAARNKTVALRLPEADFDGITVTFCFLGVRKSFVNPISGSTLRVDFTADETAAFALGTHFAHVEAESAGGKYIVGDGMRIKVTDTAADAYGVENTIDLLASAPAAPAQIGTQLPDLSDINSNPQTPEETRNSFVQLLNRLKAAAALSLALFAFCFALNADELQIYTARSGSLPYSANVVTNVTLKASESINTNTVLQIIESTLEGDANITFCPINYETGKLEVKLEKNLLLDSLTVDGVNFEDKLDIEDAESAFVKMTAKEKHADSATNIVWQTCYSNGWVFLRAISNNLGEANE